MNDKNTHLVEYENGVHTNKVINNNFNNSTSFMIKWIVKYNEFLGKL
jgi:hypothetical protein